MIEKFEDLEDGEFYEMPLLGMASSLLYNTIFQYTHGKAKIISVGYYPYNDDRYWGHVVEPGATFLISHDELTYIRKL
jgi:hypothetical protein